MNLNTINRIAYNFLGSKSSHSWKERGNKYYHGQRTGRLCLTLRQYILPQYSGHDDILTVASWFHDILNGVNGHEKKGAILTRSLLRTHCTSEDLNEICSLVSLHDSRGKQNTSIYLKLLQDADLLDHFGVFDIWSAFLYAVPHNQTMHDVISWLKTKRLPKYEEFLSQLHFELSKKIFKEKNEFLINFTERFDIERQGMVCSLDTIIDELYDKNN